MWIDLGGMPGDTSYSYALLFVPAKNALGFKVYATRHDMVGQRCDLTPYLLGAAVK